MQVRYIHERYKALEYSVFGHTVEYSVEPNIKLFGSAEYLSQTEYVKRHLKFFSLIRKVLRYYYARFIN